MAIHGIMPDIVIAVLSFPGSLGREEPWVKMGGMVDDEIHYQGDAALMAAITEGFEVLERAVVRVDSLIVRDIIAVIEAGGGLDRGEPDGVHPEGGYVIEPADYPLQVSYPIAIGIHEAAWVYLIDNEVLEPILLSLLHIESPTLNDSKGAGIKPSPSVSWTM